MPLAYLSVNCHQIVENLVSAESLARLLATEPTIKEKEGAPCLHNIQGHVEFSNVRFGYDKRQAIRTINISLSAGQLVVIVGTTGTGKSTLVNLLWRSYDVDSGSIQIDDCDICDVTLASLWDTVGIVPQTPVLSEKTILDNLRYAKPSASRKEIERACRFAAIHDTIHSFPGKYETEIGDQGTKLSGGEIKRLVLAQQVLKQPPILVIDEVTSALDNETGAAIQDALVRERQGKTTFVISHRLPGVATVADLVLVMADGAIVAGGKHEELLEQEGLYRDLWFGETNLQQSALSTMLKWITRVYSFLGN